MKIVKLLPLVLLVFLAGCELIGPSVRVSGPKVIVDDSSNSNGTHCPPGQAKKGKC
ncbi:hypothetical protein [Shewanella sp. Arc9-LZ]|jgi:hypothetical protein|uniref:hypothetical protein n=1 Tax=Shewanella TaxID=22 RepID=UPI001584215F|nr:hypothetical protein [Shewanella sp. Arc9-LZ]